jgi:hypothetical protein
MDFTGAVEKTKRKKKRKTYRNKCSQFINEGVKLGI